MRGWWWWTLLVVLAVPAAAAAAPPSIEGWVIDESECASGGPKTFFHPGGVVVREGCGDDCPVVTEGTWRQRGDEVHVQWTRRFLGRGVKQAEGTVAARIIYETYRAVAERIDEKDVIDWKGPSQEAGCETFARHDRQPEARALLRNGLKGRYPHTAERELDPAELAPLSGEELKIMRNEIFARYGYTFKDKALRKHFTAQAGYTGGFVDVGAFLSPIESKNVGLIKQAEKALKKE